MILGAVHLDWETNFYCSKNIFVFAIINDIKYASIHTLEYSMCNKVGPAWSRILTNIIYRPRTDFSTHSLTLFSSPTDEGNVVSSVSAQLRFLVILVNIYTRCSKKANEIEAFVRLSSLWEGS